MSNEMTTAILDYAEMHHNFSIIEYGKVVK